MRISPRGALTPRRAIGLGIAAVLVAGSATALASTLTQPAVSFPALPSVIPSWAKTAKVVGATPAGQGVFLTLALRGRDQAGLEAYGRAASTPGNPLYRHWLTKQQFEDTYAPAGGAATAVESVLKALGITNVMVDKLGLSVSLDIPASVASTVFGVQFRQVMHAGQSTRVALNEPTLPSALVPYVASIGGLTQETVHTDHVVEPSSAPTANLPVGGTAPTGIYDSFPTESNYYGEKPATDKPTAAVLSGDSSTTKPYIVKGYTPAQLRGAYDVDKTSYTGKGVKVGVALWDDGPTVASDLATYSSTFGLPAPDYTDLSTQNQAIDVAAGGAPVIAPLDAATEQTLDVESIHLMAPDASIVYSGAVVPEDPAIYVALITAMADGVEVINNSYGGVGDTDMADATQFSTLVTDPAKSMGIGLDFSSGDGADEVAAEGVREVDFPSSSDSVTAVGGTGIEVGASNNYEGEFYWGTYSAALSDDGKSWGGFASQAGGAGGGGGVSTFYAEPDWQKGVVPAEETENADTGTGAGETTGVGVDSPGRVTPDVAMIADSTTGILVGETMIPDAGPDGSQLSAANAYNWFRIGGTSVASPIFTGMMALVDQAIGKSAGFVNPTIYTFQAKNNGAFRDPHLGRSVTGSRLGSTAAQVLTGVSADGTTYTGAGSGVVPVVSEVRPDYTDTSNPGYGTCASDPVAGVVKVTCTAGGNDVVYHLRGEGILGTLEDLPGFDDSTGLGSPDAPAFIADFLGVPVPVTASPTPTTSASATPKPTTTAKPKCAVRTSSIKVYGPSSARRNSHGQVKYTFKLFVNKGSCATPSAVGRQFLVYVDGKKSAVLRTGKGGVQSYLVRVGAGRHTITATFVGAKDLKKSSSAKFKARIF